MILKFYKPYSSGKRHHISVLFNEITKIKPEKSLILKNQRHKGRNNFGKITIRHKGGGHKKKYRLIDFKRNKHLIEGKIASIEYDPNRNSRISLVKYIDGEKRYILHPNNLKVVNMNNAAIDAGVEAIVKVDVPEEWLYAVQQKLQ